MPGHQVQDLTHLPFAERELMLIKVAVNTSARRDILDIADIFRAKAIDVSDHTVTLQVLPAPKLKKENPLLTWYFEVCKL